MTLLVLCSGLALIAFLADFLFLATWWPPYFRHGVLIYREHAAFAFPRIHGPRFMPTASALEGEFTGWMIGLITFEQLESNEVALRQRFKWTGWRRSSPTFLHGRLTLDPRADRIVLEVWANWAPLTLVLLAMAAAREEQVDGWMWVAGLGLALLAALNLLEIFAYRQILRHVADQMFSFNQQTAPLVSVHRHPRSQSTESTDDTPGSDRSAAHPDEAAQRPPRYLPPS